MNKETRAWLDAVQRYNKALKEARENKASFSVGDTYAGRNLPRNVAELRHECIRLHAIMRDAIETTRSSGPD